MYRNSGKSQLKKLIQHDFEIETRVSAKFETLNL